MTLARHLLTTAGEAPRHGASHSTRVRLLAADPRSASPAVLPTFEGELVAIKTPGVGWVTGGGLAYLLMGVVSGSTLSWAPVSIGLPYTRLDCTGNPWTIDSWKLCGF